MRKRAQQKIGEQAAGDQQAAAQKKGSAARFIRDILVVVFAALIISVLLKTFLIRSFYIPSSSMEETLQINDRVMVNQLVPDVMSVKRGDIIVFKDPGGWLMGHPTTEATVLQKALEFLGLQPDTSNNYLIKRVIGKGGDRVKCCNADGRVTVNGMPLWEESYIKVPENESAASGIEFDVTVPEGKLWVMGDNRYGSQDSRYQQDTPGGGFVPESDVVGRAFLLNWPLNRLGILSINPDIFAYVPEPKEDD